MSYSGAMDLAGPSDRAALSMDLIFRALEALEPNDMAINVRLISKDIGSYFSQLLHCTARFSMSLPPSASDAAWQPHLQQAFRQLPFRVKGNTLAAAARSGSEVNLELAWRLVQPSVSLIGFGTTHLESPGAAAIRSGHLHLLPWLAHHGCLGIPRDTLAAALERCSLPEVQRAWELLGCSGLPYGGISPYDQRHLAEVTARTAGPDTAKMSWLLSIMLGAATQQHRHDLVGMAAVGAAASGNLPLLRWLWGQQGLGVMLTGREGLSLFSGEGAMRHETLCGRVLRSALQHDHVAVAEWLVDEVGWPLPLEQDRAHVLMWEAAGGGRGGEAVRWLLDRGVPVQGGGLWPAAKAGNLETVRLLHEDHGVPLDEEMFVVAAGSGSVPTASWLLQAGCRMSKHAYGCAASEGDIAMIKWLAREAGCPWNNRTLSWVISAWPSDASSMALLEATVRELVAAGCPPGGGTDDADIVGHAAAKGHLSLVRYLHEELGVAFAPGTLALAAAGGCEPVLEWLVGAGCLLGKGAYLNPYTEAGFVGDVDTMACLRRLGVPWGEDVLAHRRVPLPAMRWLVEQGAPWDKGALRRAMREPHNKEYRDTIAWFEARLGNRRSGVGRATGQAAGGGPSLAWHVLEMRWLAVLAGICMALAAVVYPRWAAC